jgi:hypothetical protein
MVIVKQFHTNHIRSQSQSQYTYSTQLAFSIVFACLTHQRHNRSPTRFSERNGTQPKNTLRACTKYKPKSHHRPDCELPRVPCGKVLQGWLLPRVAETFTRQLGHDCLACSKGSFASRVSEWRGGTSALVTSQRRNVVGTGSLDVRMRTGHGKMRDPVTTTTIRLLGSSSAAAMDVPSPYSSRQAGK